MDNASDIDDLNQNVETWIERNNSSPKLISKNIQIYYDSKMPNPQSKSPTQIPKF